MNLIGYVFAGFFMNSLLWVVAWLLLNLVSSSDTATVITTISIPVVMVVTTVLLGIFGASHVLVTVGIFTSILAIVSACILIRSAVKDGEISAIPVVLISIPVCFVLMFVVAFTSLQISKEEQHNQYQVLSTWNTVDVHGKYTSTVQQYLVHIPGEEGTAKAVFLPIRDTTVYLVEGEEESLKETRTTNTSNMYLFGVETSWKESEEVHYDLFVSAETLHNGL